MRLYQRAHRLFFARRLARQRPEIEVRRAARLTGEGTKACPLQGGDAHLLSKATTVRHLEITTGQARAMAIEDVDRRNRTRWGSIRRLGELVRGHELAHRTTPGCAGPWSACRWVSFAPLGARASGPQRGGCGVCGCPLLRGLPGCAGLWPACRWALKGGRSLPRLPRSGAIKGRVGVLFSAGVCLGARASGPLVGGCPLPRWVRGPLARL